MTTPDPEAAETPPPRLIAWEVTRQCPLACRHCRASAGKVAYEGEFTTDECRRLLDNAAGGRGGDNKGLELGFILVFLFHLFLEQEASD